MPVHFAGQACKLNEILEIGQKHNIPVIEDAAHAIGSEYKGKKIVKCSAFFPNNFLCLPGIPL